MCDVQRLGLPFAGQHFPPQSIDDAARKKIKKKLPPSGQLADSVRPVERANSDHVVNAVQPAVTFTFKKIT